MTAPDAAEAGGKAAPSVVKKPPPAATNRVRVVARIRPLAQYEIKNGSKRIVSALPGMGGVDESTGMPLDPEIVQVKQGEGEDAKSSNNKRFFELDAVLDGESKQSEVYAKSGARQAVKEDIFSGFNCTILAYGQTGAGKTFTMGTTNKTTAADGDDGLTAIQEMDGVIPRACHDLFQGINARCDGNASVQLSFLEIYNEEIRDLMVEKDTSSSGSKKKLSELRIRETLNGEVYVSGLQQRPVKNPAEIGKCMEEASQRRVVAATQMNATSSRSHAICVLTIQGVLEDSTKFKSKLTLVDLAGSERLKKTGAKAARATEGININKGLFVLGQVVSALSEQRPKFKRKPPFRDSKLTRLLQDSLGGNSRTIMIACCSPADFNLDETINTLRYATSARNIQTTATRNVVQSISPEEAAKLQRTNQLLSNQVKELQATVERMAKELEEANGGADSQDELSGDEDEVDESQLRIMELEHQVTELQASLAAKAEGKEGSDAPGSPPMSPKTPRFSVPASAGPTTPGSMRSSMRRGHSRRSIAHIDANAMIEVPQLKLKIATLEEQVSEIDELREENAALQEEVQELKVDAQSSRVAANHLSKILDQLQQLKDDEMAKKRLELDHLKIEEAWVNFVCQMMESNKEQIEKLRDDFYLVIRVVEQQQELAEMEAMGSGSSSASNRSKPNSKGNEENAENKEEGRKWWNPQRIKDEILQRSSHGTTASGGAGGGGDRSTNPMALQQELLQQHIDFFDSKLEEVAEEIMAESDTLLSMRESLKSQRQELSVELGSDEVLRDSLDNVDKNDSDLLNQLTSLLIGGPVDGVDEQDEPAAELDEQEGPLETLEEQEELLDDQEESFDEQEQEESFVEQEESLDEQE